ncbi:amidase [Rhypophila decipiens]|uniref:Amidase n=1 Tax=Rhypophila decipiens TaxID=261697 RepID=A0AAN7B0M5_9PEZI|nr:amidase [Rhypophila decipiens]
MEPATADLSLLLQLTIETASNGLQSGLFTSVDLAKAYLARIEEASNFNAVLQTNPDALTVAKKLDDELASSGPRGPFHGIPLLVKDNIATNDRLDVSAGSYALLGAKPAKESPVVSRLRQAGAVILGKTNLSEWANFRGLNISSGWSPRGGQTLGAYHPESQPEGSSSGSAVAAALALCTAAIGTETWGSILGPAEKNGVVGLKPSRGLVGNDGTIPISSRQAVIGTLTRTVKDAAYMLTSVAGRSDVDERTWDIPFEKMPDFTQFCKGAELAGISIGVPRNAFDLDAASPIMKSFERALKTLEAAGETIVDNANFSGADEFRKLNQQVKGIVRCSEFKRDIVQYLESLETNPNNILTAEDIIEFTKSFPGEEFPERDIGKFLWTQAEGIDVNSDTYKHMVEQEKFFGGEGGILGALERYKVDVLVVPSSFNIATDLAAKMGYPELSVPLGFYPEDTPVKKDGSKPHLVTVAPGIPYSLTLLTKSFGDGLLLQVGYAFEQLTNVREKGPEPFKTPKTELKDST